MSLLTLRTAIAVHIKANIAGLATCEGHAGRFDAVELKRIATRAPAIYVACLGLADATDEMGGASAPLQWIAYVITKDKPGLPRDQSALAFVNALVIHLMGQRWGLDDAEGRPDHVRATNLYADDIDREGVAMWAVSWRQRMFIGGESDLASLNAFLTYHADHSVAAGGDEPPAVDELNLQ